MIAKKQLGQFFTTNTNTILHGLAPYIAGKNVLDPFAGAGDLLAWAKRCGAQSVRGFDIDRAYVNDETVFYRDSFAAPLKAEFVLTNPPYLYQNKMQDNSLLRHSRHTDLYQLSLEKLMDSEEGIVIVPINFLSAENAKYIRQSFLDKFALIKANYFTNQVFADTTYNVIAFYYRKKPKAAESMAVNITVYPENKLLRFQLYRRYAWQIGGEFLAEIKNCTAKMRISRLEAEDLAAGERLVQVAYNHLDCRREMKISEESYRLLKNNIIILKAIDTGAAGGEICLDDIRNYDCDGLVSLKTSRNQIQLILPPEIGIAAQERIIRLFNAELSAKRAQYHSLFMTNYRDKDRKRISFSFAYRLAAHLCSRVTASGEKTGGSSSKYPDIAAAPGAAIL